MKPSITKRSIFTFSLKMLSIITINNYIHHNDTRHNGAKHNDTQFIILNIMANSIMALSIHDTQPNVPLVNYLELSIMVKIANIICIVFTVLKSAVMLSVIKGSFVAPLHVYRADFMLNIDEINSLNSKKLFVFRSY
jgi:hypothetical protein